MRAPGRLVGRFESRVVRLAGFGHRRIAEIDPAAVDHASDAREPPTSTALAQPDFTVKPIAARRAAAEGCRSRADCGRKCVLERTYECAPPATSMRMAPERPSRSPVPESGTTVTVNSPSPRVMIPLCCSTNVPLPMHGARDVLHRRVAGRSLDAGAERQHLAFARRLQIAVKLLVDGEPAERGVFAGRQRCELHVERTGRSHRECFHRLPHRITSPMDPGRLHLAMDLAHQIVRSVIARPRTGKLFGRQRDVDHLIDSEHLPTAELTGLTVTRELIRPQQIMALVAPTVAVRFDPSDATVVRHN